MRSKTQLEKDFNKLAKKYGQQAFTAQDFDKNDKLQKALKSFELAKTYELANDFSNIKYFPDYHHDFLSRDQNIFDDESIFIENEIIEGTAKLFAVTHLPAVKDIACREYYDAYTQGFTTEKNDRGEEIQNFELNEKIEKFHNFCLNINHAKKFINDQYPQWSKADKKEKSNIIKELEKLKKSLSPFCADLKVINIAYFLITEYKRLNQDKELKVRVLLHLHLPNIETKLIARNIVKNLPPKYQ
jgi:hypothetical protein